MAHGSGVVDSKLVSSFQIGGVGSFSCSGDCPTAIQKRSCIALPNFLCGMKQTVWDCGTGSSLNGKIVEELDVGFDHVAFSEDKLISFPKEVKLKWKSLNERKSRRDLGFLTWNVNGRLDLRGCRESLVRQWILRGSVDLVFIQKHFQGCNTGSVNFKQRLVVRLK